ncbi:MAG: hypothetical protein JWP87_807 [Labilithrix sp.]|nr:hypothetical protein [Labilithrix sp.]
MRAYGFLGTVFFGALVLSAGVAAADERDDGCDRLSIRIERPLPPRWNEPMARACRELATMQNADPTARLRISAAGDDLAIEVVLADGRKASRTMKRTEALRPTLEALLLVPAEETATAPVAAPAPAPAPVVPAPATEEPRAAPDAASRDVGVELGGGPGVRIAGNGYVSFAPAAYAELVIGRWLFGMTVRWDVVESKSVPAVKVFEMETVGAGLLVGRRFDVGFGTTDIGVAPRLLAETQSYELGNNEESRSETDIRIGAFTRVAFGHSAVRFVLEADAELSPARVRRDVFLDPVLPALPAWSAGLLGGLQWAGR